MNCLLMAGIFLFGPQQLFQLAGILLGLGQVFFLILPVVLKQVP